jgi:hypothetical protein
MVPGERSNQKSSAPQVMGGRHYVIQLFEVLFVVVAQ